MSFRFQSQKDEMRTDQNKILKEAEEKGASRDLWGAGGGDGGGDDADADEKITCSVSTWQLLHQMGQVEGGAQE